MNICHDRLLDDTDDDSEDIFHISKLSSRSLKNQFLIWMRLRLGRMTQHGRKERKPARPETTTLLRRRCRLEPQMARYDGLEGCRLGFGVRIPTSTSKLISARSRGMVPFSSPRSVSILLGDVFAGPLVLSMSESMPSENKHWPRIWRMVSRCSEVLIR